jgi:DNA-binding NtrC family response regulator
VLAPTRMQDRATAGALSSGFFFDYHTLPVDRGRLVYCLGHAYGKAVLRQSLSSRLDGAQGRYGMIGVSAKMQALYAQLEKVVQASASVLISGESGVGKELVALAIHKGSSRAKGPFVPVNCGALPESLIESLLFGHERGAFTGAHERRVGCIEAANRGTLFLDEIADLPLPAQASLLRFLQESTVVRVGSTRPLQIDTRVLAATHTDLRSAVRCGRFREDLFYRLNVLNVEVPPLRERENDCLRLAEHFFRAMSKSSHARGYGDDALQAMRKHSWPGNVRELMNRVQNAMVMCDGPVIRASDLKLDRLGAAAPLLGARGAIEKKTVESALMRCHNNIAAAARELGISRVTLYRWLHRLQIPLRPDRVSSARRDPHRGSHEE